MILDSGRISYDGVTYEPVAPLMGVKERLYQEKYEGDLYLRFEFEGDSLPESLCVAVEPLNYTSVEMNCSAVTLTDTPWFDPSFRTADISAFVKTGVNHITFRLPYYQRDYVYYVLYGGVSETLRNCLNFDTEIEPIYLFGHFRVETEAEHFIPGERNGCRYDGRFALATQTNNVDCRNVVTDGYPFYGGKLTFSADYEYAEGKPSTLRLNGRYAVAEISVNGEEAAKLLFTDRADLASFLKEGTNHITVTVCNAYRNLMGPHHLPEIETFWTSPYSFTFEGDWHDGECKRYNPTYSFIRYGFDA
jgi:hypothetical protein